MYNYYIGNWHPEATKKVYKIFRIRLMTTLPMDHVIFLELLRNQSLLPDDLWEQVQAKTTTAEKTAWFLDKAIEPSLYIDEFEPLYTLLTVMSDEVYLKNHLLKELAVEIEQELNKEASPIFVKDTS